MISKIGRVGLGVKGTGLVFLLFPIAHAVVQVCFNGEVAQTAGTIFFVLGLGLIIGSLKAASPTAKAMMGLLAGFFLWAAVGEVPHHTGRGLHVGPDHWGLVLVVGSCYLLGGGRERAAASRQGVQIAFEFFLVVWALHVLLLTAYYDPRLGVKSWGTIAIFWTALLSLWPLAKRLKHIEELGEGIRVGVVVASLLWTAVEILMKWGYLPKPWKPMDLLSIALCAVLLVGWILWPTAADSGSGRR